MGHVDRLTLLDAFRDSRVSPASESRMNDAAACYDEVPPRVAEFYCRTTGSQGVRNLKLSKEVQSYLLNGPN